MKEKNRGITLIALIITIIVMLILVAVSVQVLIKSNLIGVAEQTTTKFEEENEKEKNITGQITINGVSLDELLPLPEVKAGQRATSKSQYNSVVVPEGFTVSMIPSEQNVEDGLVIYDIPERENVNWADINSVQTKYNQFVYVPTGNFYVGRYEVGCEEERTDTTVDLNAPLLKRDLFPYNYVTCEEAKSLCENMYPNLDINLCNANEIVAIDLFLSNKTGIHEIKLGGGFSRDTSFGNFYNTAFTVTRGKVARWNNKVGVYSSYNNETSYSTGTSGLYFEVNEEKTFNKEKSSLALLSTGAVDSFKINNIYDFYGNLMEYCDDMSLAFISSYETYGSCVQSNFVNIKHIGGGFRPVIHLD